MGWHQARELWIVLAATALATAALFAAGADGWQGAPDSCLVGGQCFCERDRGGWVRQPANTASNLGFVAVGLGIAWHLARERRAGRHPRPGNPMTATRLFPGAYAGVAALLGPGSMALHASLKSWGSVLDIASMNLFIAFLLCYALSRLAAARGRPLGLPALVALFAGLNAVLLAIKLVHGHGSAAFGVLAVATLGVELARRRTTPARSDGRWLAAAAGLFAASFAVWLASHNDGPLCDPDSWLQGHGLWHLGCAGAVLCLYVYARSERGAG